jgi:MOSC domain-containing protein YiiM
MTAGRIKPRCRQLRSTDGQEVQVLVQPTVTSVNVMREPIDGYRRRTGIDKWPVAGPVQVGADGLAHDRQFARSHGGPDRAVYAYAEEDREFWEAELGHPIRAGWFGENLDTRGLPVTDAEIGEQWRIGSVLLQVQQPRTPCENLSTRVGIKDFHLRFNDTGRVGAMLRVLEPGRLQAGDEVRVVLQPGHGVTIGRYLTDPEPGGLRRLMDSDVKLARPVGARVRRILARAEPVRASPPTTA